MKNFALLTIAAGIAVTCLGQVSVPQSKQPLPLAIEQSMKLRDRLTEAVVRFEMSPDVALKELRAAGPASLVASSREEAFAEAAMDIGYRLLGREQPGAAEAFFRVAEQTLANSVAADKGRMNKADRASHLRRLAQLRGGVLQNRTQAVRDIDEAIALQPEDESLRRARKRLNLEQPTASAPKSDTK